VPVRAVLPSPPGPKPGGSGLDSSLGVQRSPLRRYKCCASTPGSAEAFPLARRRQPPNSFRPCRSTRLRRFTPLSTVQVYCTLQPAMGFAMFLAQSLRLGPKALVARLLHPRWRRPFEAFPSLVAVPCRHGLCPLAVPCRFCGLSARVATCVRPVRRVGQPQGLEPPSSPLLRLSVAAMSPLDAPLGFESFQGKRTSVASSPEGPSAPLPSRKPRLGRQVRHRQRDFPFDG
jgi:hypothetical protein